MDRFNPPVTDMMWTLESLGVLQRVATLRPREQLDAATVADLLGEAGRFIAEEVAPTNRPGDEIGSRRQPDGTVLTPPGIRDAYDGWVRAGWGSLAADPEFGGGGMPWLVGAAVQELLCAANMALSLCPMLTQGAVELISAHGSAELRSRYLPRLISGEWTGTMDLTEPDAGSDLGAVRTRAEPRTDGTWSIVGTKIFITWGEHDLADNIVHCVLARTPDAPVGTRGISCFIVPKVLPDGFPNDLVCVSIERKLGIHASPTCVMSYGDGGGATGWLIGEINGGMSAMFTMMNRARQSVGLEGVGLAERATQLAKAYAEGRRQGRAPAAAAGPSPIIEHPDVARMLATMRALTLACRCLLYETAAVSDVARFSQDPAMREAAADRAALLTPLAKAWSTDVGIRVADLGIQVHGGVGFVEETGAAQHLRDARITAIYEGTNGIQAIDLISRKLQMRDGDVLAMLLEELREVAASMSGAVVRLRVDLGRAAANLRAAIDACERGARHLSCASREDALAGATPYLSMLGTTTAVALFGRAVVQSSKADASIAAPYVAPMRLLCEQMLPPAIAKLSAVIGEASLLADAV